MYSRADYQETQNYKESKPVKNTMDLSDISGAKPKRRFDSRHSQKLGEAGNMIIDNNMMVAAGVKQVNKPGQAVSDAFKMGYQYDSLQNKNERNPLSTHDINGSKKVNQFGQKMYTDENLVNQVAGQIKAKANRFENSVGENKNKGTGSQNRSQIFNYDLNAKSLQENLPPIKIGEYQKKQKYGSEQQKLDEYVNHYKALDSERNYDQEVAKLRESQDREMDEYYQNKYPKVQEQRNQAHQLPPRVPQHQKKQLAQPSIIQDPQFMSQDQQSGNRKSTRHSKVDAQNKFENQFQKPTSGRDQQIIDQLYFKSNQEGSQRIVNKNQNYSSVERVFGIDQNLEEQENSGRLSNGGKKQFVNGSSSHQNLFSGNYGNDQNSAPNYKPYSKHSSKIEKPITSKINY